VSDETNPVIVVNQERSSVALVAKRIVQACFLLWVTPRLLSCWVSSLVWGRNRAFLMASEAISRVPGMRGIYSRQAFYRVLLSECGRDVYFGWQSVFSMREASVADNAYIGRRCSVGYARIGANVMLADGVQVLSGGREHGISEQSGVAHQIQAQTFSEVTIRDGAWIGTNAVVMASVGKGSIIGAGAVVNKPVPDHTVAAGVPARKIRQIEPQ